MNLEINVISAQMVTPSSPTSPHLNKYKLSFIDRIMPSFLSPNVIFYPPNNETLNRKTERSNQLKKSLSKALTLYYPLAGRLVDNNSYVNCNDEGITYVEAQANHNLFDVITNRLFVEELNKLVPCDPDYDGIERDLCFAVQVTFFRCGGLAIGFSSSHKIFDGVSLIMFINTWAAFSRGDEDDLIQSPVFESSILFPPEDLVKEFIDFDRRGKTVTKMFVFSSQKIAELRDKYTNSNTKDDDQVLLIRPTRIETLSAFIQTRFMVATKPKNDQTRIQYGLRLMVNIRTRVVPSLSEYHFGNLIARPTIDGLSPPEKDDEDGVYNIVKKIRDAIHHVNDDNMECVKKEVEKELENKVDVMCLFSSLCNFQLNRADFGYGLPVWIGTGNVPLKNTVYFTNSLQNNGIDALVNMKKEDMEIFEADQELLKYISS